MLRSVCTFSGCVLYLNGYLCLCHIHVFYLEELRSLGPVAPLCFLLCICTNLRLLMALIVEKPMFRMSCGFFPIFWGSIGGGNTSMDVVLHLEFSFLWIWKLFWLCILYGYNNTIILCPLCTSLLGSDDKNSVYCYRKSLQNYDITVNLLKWHLFWLENPQWHLFWFEMKGLRMSK